MWIAAALSCARASHSELAARPGYRNRPLDRCAIPASTAGGRAPRWGELLPGVSISELHRDHRRGWPYNKGVSFFRPAGAPGQPATRWGPPVFLALPANRLEIVVLYAGPVPAGTRAGHRL